MAQQSGERWHCDRDRFVLRSSAAAENGAEPVGEVLKRWIARSGLLRVTDRERVWGAWCRLLGRDADHTRLERLRNNVATFVVDSGVLLSELNNFRKQECLERLREEVKSYFVRDIRFRLEKKAAGTLRSTRPPGVAGQ